MQLLVTCALKDKLLILLFFSLMSSVGACSDKIEELQTLLTSVEQICSQACNSQIQSDLDKERPTLQISQIAESFVNLINTNTLENPRQITDLYFRIASVTIDAYIDTIGKIFNPNSLENNLNENQKSDLVKILSSLNKVIDKIKTGFRAQINNEIKTESARGIVGVRKKALLFPLLVYHLNPRINIQFQPLYNFNSELVFRLGLNHIFDYLFNSRYKYINNPNILSSVFGPINFQMLTVEQMAQLRMKTVAEIEKSIHSLKSELDQTPSGQPYKDTKKINGLFFDLKINLTVSLFFSQNQHYFSNLSTQPDVVKQYEANKLSSGYLSTLEFNNNLLKLLTAFITEPSGIYSYAKNQLFQSSITELTPLLNLLINSAIFNVEKTLTQIEYFSSRSKNFVTFEHYSKLILFIDLFTNQLPALSTTSSLGSIIDKRRMLELRERVSALARSQSYDSFFQGKATEAQWDDGGASLCKGLFPK